MSLLTGRNHYAPFEYPKAEELWSKHERAHWMVEEIDFNEDRKDWDHKLTDGERNLLSKLFRFFTLGDEIATNTYFDKYMPVLGKHPEIKMMMGSFGNREGLHQKAYKKLLDTVGMDASEFSAFKNHKQMMAKYDYLMSFDPAKFKHIPFGKTEWDYDEERRELARSLACYSGFLEGMQLFSSFAILMNFSRFGKMKGMNKVVEWSVRDEELHVEGMTWLFRTFIQENPDIWTDDFKKEIYDICRSMVKLEDNFIDLCFKESGDLEGLTPEEVKRYIRWVADKRLLDLGLKRNYHVAENPLPWMDWMLMDSHTNFFEARVTEYSKAHNADDWENVNW